MKNRIVTLLVVLVLLAAAGSSLAYAETVKFRARLSGSSEVPAVDTQAEGKVKFKLSEDGTALEYKLHVTKIENVLMAHIHLAPAGTNGSVVAWLYPDAPPAVLIPGRFDGLLASGTITSADLVGPLAGMTLQDLLAAMEAGNTYVNVHTSQFPGGEIRGQVH